MPQYEPVQQGIPLGDEKEQSTLTKDFVKGIRYQQQFYNLIEEQRNSLYLQRNKIDEVSKQAHSHPRLTKKEKLLKIE